MRYWEILPTGSNFVQVLSTREPLLNVEMWASALPNRTEPGKWIEDYFPITDSKGNVTHIAIVVVEASQSGMDLFSERPSSASPDKPSLSNRIQVLRSWKEIASYAKRFCPHSAEMGTGL